MIDQIIASIAPRAGDYFVEIGPGEGAITAPLVTRVAQLHVLEIDRDLAALLPQRLGEPAALTVHVGDVLKADLADLMNHAAPCRVVGNLPYHITTPILFKLLELGQVIEDIHIMVQREVALRMVAKPGMSNYGRLSVMLQTYCEISHLFDIAPDSFSPPPKVTSSMVRLTPLKLRRVVDEHRERFERLVRDAFSQRRKTLRNSLRAHLSSEDMAAKGIDATARAESLSVEQFARLAAVGPASDD